MTPLVWQDRVQATYRAHHAQRLRDFQTHNQAQSLNLHSRVQCPVGGDAQFLTALLCRCQTARENGGATVLMVISIDPYMSGITDDVVDGTTSEGQFRKAVVWLVASRPAGTLLAQVLLLPSAMLIVHVARAI